MGLFWVGNFGADLGGILRAGMGLFWVGNFGANFDKANVG